VHSFLFLVGMGSLLLILIRWLRVARSARIGGAISAFNRERKEQAIRAIRSWVQSLPQNVAQLTEEQVPYEYVVRIVPRNKRAADINFRISDYGTFGLYVSAIRIEELPLSAQ